METLKDDGRSGTLTKWTGRSISKPRMPLTTGHGARPKTGRWTWPGSCARASQELREIVAQLFEGMDEYAGMRFVRGYHIGAASVMEEHGIPGAEAHAQLVPGLENLPVALQEVKRQQRKVFGAQALCSMEVMRSMLLYQSETGLNPEISPDVRESYLWGLILDLEKELCGELSEEYQEKLDQLRLGVKLEDGPTAPAIVNLRDYDHERGFTLFDITIHEGRNRQIRRMCDAIGFPVRDLKRIKLGPLQLQNLGRGKFRSLSEQELSQLRKAAKL